ncbi:MAG: FAD-dependent oxidoreductase, partial [Paracoccaceae bacterium]
MQIAIIGAGIGGLAAAALLAPHHHVTLIERFATPRPLGSGLVVQPVGLAVLDAIGAGDAARALGAPITHMLGHAGPRAVLDVHYRAHAPGLAMHRASLFHVLWQAAQSAGTTIVTGAQITAAPLHGSKRHITGPETNLGPFDLVIDASGTGSPLSPLQSRPLPFGAVWGQGPWPETDLPTNRLSQRYLGAHHMAGVLPIGRLPDDPTPRAAVFWSLPRTALEHWPTQDMPRWKAEVTTLWPAMAPFL